MIFNETDISGLYVIEQEPFIDNRGSFARHFCIKEFTNHGLETVYMQQNISVNFVKGTFRGLHGQKAPHEEVKYVTCYKGRIFDIAVDFRKLSTTYGKWFGIELSEDNHKSLYIPRGMLHGFLSLEDDSRILYMVSEYYRPDFEIGFRYDDPAFQIKLPFDPVVVSDKDLAWPDFKHGY